MSEKDGNSKVGTNVWGKKGSEITAAGGEKRKTPRGQNSGLQTKADSTRALKTPRLKRLTKRVATPTQLSNEEVYKYARSNIHERF